MALRLAVKGVVALSAATLTFFSYASLQNDTPSTTPYAPSPYSSHSPLGCGFDCPQIPPTPILGLFPTPSPVSVPQEANLTQEIDPRYEPLAYISFGYDELLEQESTYNVSPLILNLVQAAISGSSLGDRLPHWAHTYLSTFAFHTLTFFIPHATIPTASDLVLLLWIFLVSCLVTLLNSRTFNHLQLCDRQSIELLQVQAEANDAEIVEKDQLLANYRSECEVKDAKANDYEKDLDRIRKDQDTATVRLGECEKTITELCHDIETGAKDIRILKNEKATAIDDARLAREQRDSVRVQLEEKNTVISALEAAGEVSSRRLSEMELEGCAGVLQLDAKVAENSSLQSLISQLQHRIEDLQTRDQQAISLLADRDNIIADLRVQLNSEQTRATNLEVAVLAKVQTIKTVEEELSEVQQAFTRAQGALDGLRAVEESAQLVMVERNMLVAYKEHAEEEKAGLEAEIEKGASQLKEEREAQEARLAELVVEHEEHAQRMVEEHRTVTKDLERTYNGVIQGLEKELHATNATLEELRCSVEEHNRDEITSTVQSSLASPPTTPLSTRVIDHRQPTEGSLSNEVVDAATTTMTIAHSVAASIPEDKAAAAAAAVPSSSPNSLEASTPTRQVITMSTCIPLEEVPITNDVIEIASSAPEVGPSTPRSRPDESVPTPEATIPKDRDLMSSIWAPTQLEERNLDSIATVAPARVPTRVNETFNSPTTSVTLPTRVAPPPHAQGSMASIWAPKACEKGLSTRQTGKMVASSPHVPHRLSNFERALSASIYNPANCAGSPSSPRSSGRPLQHPSQAGRADVKGAFRGAGTRDGCGKKFLEEVPKHFSQARRRGPQTDRTHDMHDRRAGSSA